MSLSTFIRQANDEIVARAVQFAHSLPSLADKGIDISVLSDHLPLVLTAIALDLEEPQTRQQSISKSEGSAAPLLGETAAQIHGRMRAEVGLSVSQVVAEYRVLRAVVTRLWSEAGGLNEAPAVLDLIRFNEAIDQAIAESVAFHSTEVERWRNTLLAVIGHDLRAPLSTVVLASEILARSLEGSPLSVHTDLLRRAGERLTALLDSLLEYNHASLGTAMVLSRKETSLAHACRSEMELLRSAYPNASIAFETSGPVIGMFDENRIREAVANLVTNATQYRTPGTPIHVACIGHGDHVAVTVVNEGQPIKPEVLQTYFEPLRRRDVVVGGERRRNLGIGLFIVREIVRAHGGTVAAESAHGTITFSMRLPKKAA